MDLDNMVCNCMSITKGMIKEAVDNGATTLEEVMEATGAATICGACADEVQRLTGFFASTKS
ncbi:MAG: (2Fe-2S)-binding protein [Lachnospiraceae bacterium]|nr:(2Fe-2S)-binding protein [Lachnospiraceae bacterium]